MPLLAKVMCKGKPVAHAKFNLTEPLVHWGEKSILRMQLKDQRDNELGKLAIECRLVDVDAPPMPKGGDEALPDAHMLAQMKTMHEELEKTREDMKRMRDLSEKLMRDNDAELDELKMQVTRLGPTSIPSLIRYP